MQDRYRELSDVLDEYMTLLRIFISAPSQRLSLMTSLRKKLQSIKHLGKLIGNSTAEKVDQLVKEHEIYLANPEQAENEALLIDRCVSLKNNLWEL